MTELKACELKPCPFCGGKAGFEEDWDRIQCWGCGFYYNCGEPSAKAAEKWNKRPPDPGIGNLLAKWKERIEDLRRSGGNDAEMACITDIIVGQRILKQCISELEALRSKK